MARLILLLLLAGCGDSSNTVTVEVHWVTQAQLVEKCGNDFLPEPAGCAHGYVKPTAKCDVYVATPTGRQASFDDHDVVETLGHELLHCLYGDKVHR